MAHFITRYPPSNVIFPAGGATEAKQDDQISLLDDIKTNTSDVATATKQDAQTLLLTDIDASLTDIASDTFNIFSDVNVIRNQIETLTTKTQAGLVTVAHDAIVPTYNATSDVYAYKTGGIAGTTVKTLTVNYTDATKTVITNISVV